MRFALAGAALLLNAMDNFTTFRCLAEPIAGVQVYEANPLAAWTFDSVGLVPGLLTEMLLSALAITFLVYSTTFSLRVRIAILVAMVVLPAYAVVNNLQVMREIGLPLLG